MTETDQEKPRPAGYDYTIPDVPELRCPECNPDGMNRTGMRLDGYVGLSTMEVWGAPCGRNCDKGLTRRA